MNNKIKMLLAGVVLTAVNSGTAMATEVETSSYCHNSVVTYHTACYYESTSYGYVEETIDLQSTSGYPQCVQSYRRSLHNFNLFGAPRYYTTTSTPWCDDDNEL